MERRLITPQTTSGCPNLHRNQPRLPPNVHGVKRETYQHGVIRVARVDLETSVCERPHVLAELQDVLARIVIRGAVEPV